MSFLPWYNQDLISFLNSYLKPNFNVFEYGGGNSTLYYSNLVKTVSTIETKKEWVNFVLLQKSKENIEIKLCQDLPNFSKEIANFTIKKFDLIVIDSRDRAKCLEECQNFVLDSGAIILDNSERENLILPQKNLISKGFKKTSFSGIRGDGRISYSSLFLKSNVA
jgi:hypothetical protein